jgi:putative hemolysin
MTNGYNLEINTLEDGRVHVCVTEDGFSTCAIVSSIHLAPDKGRQLRASIQRQAINAMLE